MPGAHRFDDQRVCGATTIVVEQSTVRVNGKLWAVENDLSSHGLGQLKPVTGAQNVRINGKKVICAVGDEALSDGAGHVGPGLTNPLEKSPNVFVYG